MTFWFASVGSFFSAASICFCKLLDSALAVAPVSLCGRPELCGKPDDWPSVALVPVPAVVLEVDPVLPTPVDGVVAPVPEEVVPCVLPLMLPAVLLVPLVLLLG